MFLEWENNNGKLEIFSEKLQNSRKFQNNAINDFKQISLSHVIKDYNFVMELHRGAKRSQCNSDLMNKI